ncbi:MAG: response regulator transcription factor, partial [Gammaproteobacteria bacterium]|nr:response regulator transcription factor [Gammaproteobacteria bacterium]
MANDNVHIINVEDDPAVRILTSSYLERAGYRVSEAATAGEFYGIFDQSGVDLVLLDLNLP